MALKALHVGAAGGGVLDDQRVALGRAVRAGEQRPADRAGYSTAAAAAIDVGDLPPAVELLESTRGVAWSQLPELRTDLAVIAEKHAELATGLVRVRDALDTPPAEESEFPLCITTG